MKPTNLILPLLELRGLGSIFEVARELISVILNIVAIGPKFQSTNLSSFTNHGFCGDPVQ